jgi:hypothetical protein
VRAFPASITRPFIVSAALALSVPSLGQAQAQQAQALPTASRDEIIAFAKVHVAVGTRRDSIQAQLAQPRNNTVDAQTSLRAKLRAEIAEILHHNGMTDADFRRKTFIVSTDSGARRTFDSVVAKLTGVPTPGQIVAPAPAVMMPAGPVGTHIGHVVNSFGDTPGLQGLLPAALAEARTALQHATLGSRTPTNLDAMKTHAGHVIHAVDPTIVTVGPGAGYGVKKAAAGVAAHIELAAKAQGASANVGTHANHVATAARSAIARADQVIATAQKIQAATTAADAAALYGQLISLTQQLIDGADANSDGRITWEPGEGGLQQAQQHVTLLLAGEV